MIYFLVGLVLAISVSQGYIIYRFDLLEKYIRDQFDNKLITSPKPILIERKCQFCGDSLIQGTKPTKDGYWACPTCKITKLHQMFEETA